MKYIWANSLNYTTAAIKMSFSIYLLQFITFLDLLAVGLLIPLLPAHVRSLGGNYIHVGLLGSVYAIFQLGSGPLIGSLSDLRGRRTILLITLLICSVAYTLTGLTTSVIGILCLRAVLGLFKQSQMLARAMVPEYEEDEYRQSEIFGKMASISGVGITIGPIIGGHVIERYPDHGLMYLSVAVGLCFLLNIGLVYFLPDKSSMISSRRKKGKSKQRKKCNKEPQSVVQYIWLSLKQSVIELFSIEWSIYWDLFMLKALIGFSMSMYYSNYAAYLKAVYELTPKHIGYVISFQGTIGSLSSFFIGSINHLYKDDDDYSLRNLHVFILLTFSLAGLIVSHNIYFYILFLIPLAIGNAVGRLISLEMLLKRSKDQSHRGSLIGASNSVRSLAGVVAPMTAGIISQYAGVVYPIYVSLFATFLGVCISKYMYMTKDDLEDEDYEYKTRNHKIKTE